MSSLSAYGTPNAYLALDSFSFFFSEEAQAGGEVPTISIPICLTSTSNSTWTISIEPGDMSLPLITLPGGERVQWTLISQAAGVVSVSATSGAMSISGDFHVQSLDTTRHSVHSLSFSTGTVNATAGSTTVSRDGYPLDRSSGYFQLVAASVDPPGSDHGIPFYAVLSGRVTGAPEGFLSD